MVCDYPNDASGGRLKARPPEPLEGIWILPDHLTHGHSHEENTLYYCFHHSNTSDTWFPHPLSHLEALGGKKKEKRNRIIKKSTFKKHKISH